MPLIFVPTPLGNLRDVTLRALDVLARRRADRGRRYARRAQAAARVGPARPRDVELSRAERRRRRRRPSSSGRARRSSRSRPTPACRASPIPEATLIAAARAAGVAVEVAARTERRHGRRGALRLSAAALHVRGLSAARRDGATRALRRRAARGAHDDLVRVAAAPAARRSPISRSWRPTRRSSSCASTPNCTNSISGARRSG